MTNEIPQIAAIADAVAASPMRIVLFSEETVRDLEVYFEEVNDEDLADVCALELERRRKAG